MLEEQPGMSRLALFNAWATQLSSELLSAFRNAYHHGHRSSARHPLQPSPPLGNPLSRLLTHSDAGRRDYLWSAQYAPLLFQEAGLDRLTAKLLVQLSFRMARSLAFLRVKAGAEVDGQMIKAAQLCISERVRFCSSGRRCVVQALVHGRLVPMAETSRRIGLVSWEPAEQTG